MNNMVSIFGYNVSTLSVDQIVSSVFLSDEIKIVNTINPHSYVEAKKDNDFSISLKNSDILIPDGSGIILASRVLKKTNLNKIAGFDLFISTMEKLNSINGRVFFLGSTDSVLNEILIRIKKDYPNVIVGFHSPEYKDSFNQCDKSFFIKKINDFNSDVVFVGLTAPKQEKLIYEISGDLNIKMISGIGAVFDFYSGNIKRPNDIWVRLHLEWLVRFVGEPKRLWKRNFISTPIFLKDILKHKFLDKDNNVDIV